MSTALLLLEIQNDYFANGKIPLEKSDEAAQKARHVLQICREESLPIIHVQQISTHPKATSHLPCTKGAEIYTSIAPLKGEMIIKKHYPNSFKDTSLLNHLIKNQINHLIICGMMTHITVDATVRAAYDLGFTCTVIHDACATHDLQFQNTLITAQNVHYSFLAAFYPMYANLLSADELIQRISSPALASA